MPATGSTMKLAFTKMHGAGNDFVVIDAVTQAVALNTNQVRHIADRSRGVGCDQVLVVEPPTDPDADFRYRIFNADGSEVEQCGNGARCFARFVREKRLTFRHELRVQTAKGHMFLLVSKEGRIDANMGPPVFTPSEIPFIADAAELEYSVEVNGSSLKMGALSMGNPHAVVCVDDLKATDVPGMGAAIERHSRFPERVNAGFMQVVSRTDIKLRVFERGVGETQACGTGACAAVVHGIRMGLLDNAVTAHLPGGKLTVRWAGDEQPVWLGGPTATVFEGTIRLK